MTQRAWPAWARASEILDLLRLSGPIAISRMSMMLMGLTDAIVLGQMAEHELPYVLNSWLPMGIALGFGMGILLGVQVLTSEMLGRGETHQSGRVFRRAFLWAVLLGIFLTGLVYATAGPLFHWIFVEINANDQMSATLTPAEVAAETATVTKILAFGMVGFTVSTVFSYYLEALRRPLLVTLIMYLGVFVNLIIDLALVVGWWGFPEMGAEGVAWATTGSRWFITIALGGFIIWATPALKPSDPAPEGEAWRQLSVGGGTAVSNVAEWGGFNLTYIIAAFISLATNAIYGYTVQVMGVCFMLFLGIGTATSVRVAENFGRANPQGVKDASRLGVAATFVVGVILALIVLLFSPWIALGLVDGEAQIDGILLAPAIAALLIYAAIGTTFDGLQAVCAMALRAQNVVWVPTMIHVASFFVIMLPAGYYLGIISDRGAQGMMEAAVLGVFIAGMAQWSLLEWKTARTR